MYVKGVGMTKFGIEDRNSWDLAYEAAMEALDDSDMSMKDIDAMVVSTVDTMVGGERQRHYPALASSLFKKKMPIIRVPAVCGGSGIAFWTALRLGFDNVMVLATDRVASNTTPIITKEIMNANENVWEQQEGMVFPAQNALVAQQHMMKYGTTLDDLALISFKNHTNAYTNPKTHFYKKKVTLEQIKNSPVVASPFRLFDCTISVSGAGAAIISKDKTDIKVVGSGMAVDYLPPFEREDMTTWRANVLSSKEAYKQAGIGPSDIDIAEMHDAFTIIEVLSYEDLGFCKKGDGKKLIRDGYTNIDGKLPVNTSGGLKARGHPISPTGMAQVYEIAKQLRGECGERQVERKLNYGMTQNIGGAGGSIAVHVFKKMAG